MVGGGRKLWEPLTHQDPLDDGWHHYGLWLHCWRFAAVLRQVQEGQRALAVRHPQRPQQGFWTQIHQTQSPFGAVATTACQLGHHHGAYGTALSSAGVACRGALGGAVAAAPGLVLAALLAAAAGEAACQGHYQNRLPQQLRRQLHWVAAWYQILAAALLRCSGSSRDWMQLLAATGQRNWLQGG